MNYLLFLSIVFYASVGVAQESTDEQALVNVVKDIKIDKAEIRKSLEDMKKNGKISDAEYLKALKDLEGFDEGKINALKNQAVDIIKSDPKKAEEMVNKK